MSLYVIEISKGIYESKAGIGIPTKSLENAYTFFSKKKANSILKFYYSTHKRARIIPVGIVKLGGL
jgi:hypothetical protein